MTIERDDPLPEDPDEGAVERVEDVDASEDEDLGDPEEDQQ